MTSTLGPTPGSPPVNRNVGEVPPMIGGGEMGRHVRETDWAATPLGAYDTWPQSLRSSLSLVLNAKGIAALYWGPDQWLLYNDAYGIALGDRHPRAFARPMTEVLVDIAPVLGPQVATVLSTGEGFSIENLALTMRRHGRDEETVWTYSFTPVQGESGAFAGVLLLATEMTAQKQAERALKDTEGRLRAQNLDLEHRAKTSDRERDRVWEHSKDLLGVADERGVWLSVSPAWTRTLGWQPDDIVGRTSEWMEHPDDREKTRAEVRRLAGGHATVEFENRFRTKAGDYCTLTWTAAPDAGRLYCVGRDITEERVRAVARADAERVRLALAAGAIIGTWVWDLPTDRFTIDEAFATAFGLDPALGREGIPLAQIVATVHPDDQAGLAEAIDEAVRRGGRYAHQYRVRRHDGRYHWLEANGHVEQGPDGTPLRFPGVLLDIEERRAVEAERERAVAALRDLNADLERKVAERTRARGRTWQVNPDLLSVIGGDGRFEAVNPAWTATLGWSEEDLTEAAFTDFLHPDDLAATDIAWADANERGLPVLRFQNRYRHKDGGWRWLSWVGVPDDGKVYASARDITAEIEQAEYLRQTKAREETIRQTSLRTQAALAAGSIIGTWNWNFNEDFFTFDEGFAHAFGHGPETAQTGLPIDQVLVNVHPEDRPGLDAAIADTIARGGAYARQYRVRRADGKYYWIEASGRIDHDADGKAFGFPGFIVDLDERVSLEAERDRATAELRMLSNTLEQRVAERTSELMQAEETLRQSQKMEAVGQLTGGLAHDFNNLLAVVTGNLELMAMRLGRGKFDDLGRFMASAQTASKRATSLTHRLLAFSRRQTLDPKATGINDLVEGMRDMVNRTVGPEITVAFVTGPKLWTTFVDPNQLENALLNLCINARDAMPDGGLLTIETSNQDLGPGIASIRDLPPGQYVALSVSDTGTGMSPELIERVFEPFFTTKPTGQGTGLGLSMVYGFARQSEGQVRIHSEVSHGSTVTIYLPRSDRTATADSIELVATPQQAERGRMVLVVDDQAAVRMLISDVLRDLGYGIIEAADGPTALKILQGGARVDLLITDVGMPGMNGRQLADAARVSRPHLKTLFITGYAEASVVSHGHLDADMAIMTKPFALNVLANRVRAMIDTPAALSS